MTVTPELQWLERDLSYVPKDMVVILNMHAPAWNKMETIDNILNADRLAEILAPYEAHVFAGHTHFFENVEVTPRLYQHNIAAACGAWWTSTLNRDGAPNGYMVVNVDSTDLKWSYRAVGHKQNIQMRVYKPGEFASQRDKLVVASGLKDYIVADADDVLLICPKCEEQRIRQYVNDVKASFGDKYL